MVLKAALSLRYRRRSPDALANVILGLLVVAVCLVSWELVVPASAPSLGAAPAGGRLLLQAPAPSSDDSGAFQPPPPPAPKQPKQFNGLDKARARACGRSRAAMCPWPHGLSGTHFLPPARNSAAACTSCAATATPARAPACFAEPAAHDGAETDTKVPVFLRHSVSRHLLHRRRPLLPPRLRRRVRGVFRRVAAHPGREVPPLGRRER